MNKAIPLADVAANVNDNGPYVITGDITVVDADGKEYSWEGTAVALCRGGESSNKPFCDGTHKNVGFSSEPRA